MGHIGTGALSIALGAFLSSAAFAGGHGVSEQEMAMVEDAIAAFGCGDGEVEKEDGLFEVEEADCGSGSFDIRVDDRGNVLTITSNDHGDDDDAESGVPGDMSDDDIMDFLAAMRCEMDPDDIEREDGEIELDDVFCGGGQFDITLDGEMRIMEMRAE